MIRLSDFSVVRYRGIDGLSLPRMSRVNLITGMNGSGKTALIEAMWLFTGQDPGLLWNYHLQRSRNPPANPLSTLTEDDLELCGTKNGINCRLKFRFEDVNGASPNEQISDTMQGDFRRLPPPVGIIRTYLDEQLVKDGFEGLQATPFGSVLYESPKMQPNGPSCIIEIMGNPHEIPDEHLKLYSDLVREGHKQELINGINLVMPDIQEVEILTGKRGKSYLAVTISGEGSRPFHDLGGGAVRLARFLIGIFASKDAIFLVDELENGIHYSAHRKIWDCVCQWMRQWNVQLVATSHSAEFIDAAVDAFGDCPEDLSIHKLYRNQNTGQSEVATFTGDALTGAHNLGLEVR